MKRFFGVVLFVSSLLSCQSLNAVTADAHPPVRENGNWFGAMEASLITARMPTNTPEWVAPASEKESSWLAWMGWIVAATFFILFTGLNLKTRRHYKTMTRGGEPDFFFLPPARDRRRNQR